MKSHSVPDCNLHTWRITGPCFWTPFYQKSSLLANARNAYEARIWDFSFIKWLNIRVLLSCSFRKYNSSSWFTSLWHLMVFVIPVFGQTELGTWRGCISSSLNSMYRNICVCSCLLPNPLWRPNISEAILHPGHFRFWITITIML